ncbi:acetyl transferase [Lactococcus raffinolactis 4877]|nr:acetyl transferase [Lactococcus raffinolactis 4877]
MKELFNKSITKIWGGSFEISNDIPLSYIISLVFETLFNVIRGLVKSLGFGEKKGLVFVGKKVTLKMRQKIFVGSKVRFEEGCEVIALSSEGFHLGNNVKIGPHTKMISGSISSLGKGIYIGDNCFFSDYTFFGGAGGIKIGNDIISGQNVRFHAENHNFLIKDELIRNQGVNHKGIELGSDIWIGSGVVFLDGAKVGNHCVIAANTVLNKEFPENCVIAGIPAKIIKRI